MKKIFMLMNMAICFAAYSQEMPELGLPLGHTDRIHYAQISTNGKTIVTSSDDKTAKIWDVATGQMLRSMEHSAEVIYAQYYLDENKVITFSMDNTVRIWDANSGKVLWNFDLNIEGENISAVACSPDGNTIAISFGTNPINIWDVKSGKLLKSIEGHAEGVCSIAYSPDGKKIITASWDNTARVWDAITGELLQSLVGHTMYVKYAAFSPDNKKIITSSADKTAKVWDAANGNLLITLKGHTDWVLFAIFSPDGKNILTTSRDKTARIWETASGKLTHILRKHTNYVYAAGYSVDGNVIVTVSEDKTAKIWDARNGAMIKSLEGHVPNYLSAVVYNPDGKTLAVTSGDFIVRIWSVENGKLLHVLEGHTDFIMDTRYSPDGKLLLTTSMDGTSRIWDAITGEIKHVLQGHEDFVNSGAFSPDGKSIVTVSEDNTAIIWDAVSGKLLGVLKGHTSGVQSAVFSPDGREIVTASYDGTVRVWNAESGKMLHALEGDKAFHAVIYSPDGKTIAAISTEDKILIWDPLNGVLLHVLEGHTGYVFAISFSADSKSILTASADSTARIWDAQSGKMLHMLNGHASAVISAGYSPDGNNILTISKDKTAKIWDAVTTKLLYTLVGHINSVAASAYSPDGRSIATASSDCILKIWDSKNGKELVSLIAVDIKDWICVTPDRYYMSSKNATIKLSYIFKNKIYGFEQFDVQYNRPDIVLQRIGNIDKTLIYPYYLAYLKRLKKMNFTETMFSKEFHIPEMTILNKYDISYKVDHSLVSLKVKAVDDKYKLNRLNVYVNGVPVYGTNGISFRNQQTTSEIQNVDIKLSIGENKIEVSCLNEKGVESYKETTYVTYEPSILPLTKTYFVGIGVSNYKDTSHNLSYAEKDISDLSKSFAGADTVILRNEQATKENILALKQKLLKTNIDDKVILSVSGHGVLSDSLDFYFATYDMDFEHPERRGLLYDDLESLLDSIPARKKLLMIDACHSGEIDKEEMKIDQELLAQSGVKEIEKPKGGQTLVNKNVIGMKNTFELMQELFANVSKGTGAVVISASGGKEYAIESGKWNNGVFTYCIRKALEEKAADQNGDNEISISELKEYVSKEVESLTQGRQKPTSRKENLEVDWVVK